MYYKKIFILLLILPVTLLLLPGCTTSQDESSVQSQPWVETRPEVPPTEVTLKISHAPKVGETAELTLTVDTNWSTGKNVGHGRAWLEVSRVGISGSYQESKQKIEIPVSNILVSGKTSWDVTLTERETVELHSTIRFPSEGIWEVTGYVEGDDWEGPTGDWIRLAVEHDRAGIYGSEAYRAGELEWMKDYAPEIGLRLDIPVTVMLDLSKPPRLGEPVELAWSIVSNDDSEKVRVRIEFKLMETGGARATILTSESMLVEGDLQWEGALKKDTPVSSSATIVFPKEGDWEITLYCTDAGISSMGHAVIMLNVTEERGRWGWVESHEEDRSDVPPPPRIDVSE